MRYQDVIMADRPLGLWLLDEAVGTVARGFGRAGNGTYGGSPTLGIRGPSSAIPRAISTDGTDDHVQLPTLADFSANVAETWEVWARSSGDLTASSGPKHLFGAQDASFQAMGLGGDYTGSLTNEVVTVANDRSGAADRTGWSGATIPAGWHHHVYTYNGGQDVWRYYLDGCEWEVIRAGVTKISNSGGSFGLVGSGVTFSISRAVTTYSAWAGLAAAAVYQRALSPVEVARHYWAGRNGRRPAIATRLGRP